MAYKQLKLWFDEELATTLADKILPHRQDFNKKRFVIDIKKGVEPLELKDRVEFICDKLYSELGENYEKDAPTLMHILGDENPNETGMFTEYYWVMPIAKYVEKYGLNHFDLSMNCIAEITKRNTSEYAIRPYLENHTAKTLKILEKWSKDENFHLRRLTSEGPRPRLPWATKLDIFINEPKKLIPILENLKDDKIKYVQKSVANCLNDILKDSLPIGKSIIENWIEKNMSKERVWIIKHSLRNLKKQNDEWALSILNKVE